MHLVSVENLFSIYINSNSKLAVTLGTRSFVYAAHNVVPLVWNKGYLEIKSNEVTLYLNGFTEM